MSLREGTCQYQEPEITYRTEEACTLVPRLVNCGWFGQASHPCLDIVRHHARVNVDRPLSGGWQALI